MGVGRGRGAAGSFILVFVVQSRVKGQVHVRILCLFDRFLFPFFGGDFLLCKVSFHFLMCNVLVHLFVFRLPSLLRLLRGPKMPVSGGLHEVFANKGPDRAEAN